MTSRIILIFIATFVFSLVQSLQVSTSTSYDISRCRTFRILPLPSSLPQCLSKSRCFRGRKDRKGCCASRTSGLGYQPACCIASQGKMPQVNRSLRGTVASGGINFIKFSLQRSRNPCLVKKHLEELPQVGYEGPDLGICQRLVQKALLQKKMRTK